MKHHQRYWFAPPLLLAMACGSSERSSGHPSASGTGGHAGESGADSGGTQGGGTAGSGGRETGGSAGDAAGANGAGAGGEGGADGGAGASGGAAGATGGAAGEGGTGGSAGMGAVGGAGKGGGGSGGTTAGGGGKAGAGGMAGSGGTMAGESGTGGSIGGAGGMDPGPTGLVAYWRFDEGSGTTVADSSGNGNALGRTGPSGPAWVTGKSGSAVRGLAGSSRLSGGDILNSLGLPLSISVWLYFDTQVSPNGGQLVIESESSATRRGFSLEVAPAGDRYWFRHFDSADAMRQLLAGSAPRVAAWTHVAVVTQASSIVLYVDGQPQTASPTGTATSVASASGTLTVGRSTDDTVAWSIDELRLYSRALSASEVTYLATH